MSMKPPGKLIKSETAVQPGWIVLCDEENYEQVKALASSFNGVAVNAADDIKVLRLDVLPSALEDKLLDIRNIEIAREGRLRLM